MPCRCCGRRSAPTPANAVGAHADEDLYAVLFNCSCGSTRAAVLWQSERDALDAALDELLELAGEADNDGGAPPGFTDRCVGL